jgi:hypothetical protein
MPGSVPALHRTLPLPKGADHFGTARKKTFSRLAAGPFLGQLSG